MRLAIGFALFLATPAYAEYVEVPFSGTLSSGYGDFSAGQTFTGKLSYDRFLYDQDPDELYQGDVHFSFSVAGFQYASPVAYTSFNPFTGGFLVSGARSDQTLLGFFGLKSTPGYLPTAEQFAGANGYLSFNTARGTGPDTDPIYSGGEGAAVVPAIPEPATWVAMILGLALAVGAARYRRREPQLIYGRPATA